MAADPFAFYRGSACLFYADVAELEDRWADERTSRVWIQGDLHAENFGTYMDGDGVLIFDVNDFDEAYIGHFTWDVTRFAASMALLGWRKAISDADISRLAEQYVRAYLDQVHWFVRQADDRSFSLRLDTTEGPVHQVLELAKLRTRVGLLDGITETEGFDRVLREVPGLRRLEDGDLILIDSGAVSGGYRADITRTLPINGKFSKRQREIYEIVLEAEEAAIKACKPGKRFAEIDQAARKVITKAGYGDAFIHSIGHHLGLETHDVSPDEPLRAGAVITIEPGIYLPDEKIGIRIEDDILITSKGHRNLSKDIPKAVKDIERVMKRR
jgi:hypothetical protein